MLPLLPYTRRDPLLLSATQTHSTAQKYYDRKTEKNTYLEAKTRECICRFKDLHREKFRTIRCSYINKFLKTWRDTTSKAAIAYTNRKEIYRLVELPRDRLKT